MNDSKIILCGANAYEKKYYFNELFSGLPENIKEELHVICVLFTEDVGGIFMIAFEPDGGICLETDADVEDVLYDEVSSGLLIGELRRKRQELFESLNLYYKIFILKQEAGDLWEGDL